MDTTLDVGRRIIQMLFDPAVTNDSDQPIWCLGSSYTLNNSSNPRHEIPNESAHEPSESKSPNEVPSKLPETPPDSTSSSLDSSLAYDETSSDRGWPPAFLDDFESRIWMTYRSEFSPIAKSSDPKAAAALSFSMRIKSGFSSDPGFASDTGWGCFLRAGQSLLANAMVMERVGRDWRRKNHDEEEKTIISLFADDPRAPYSIHNFVRHGELACGKYPGEWFGPSATARCIQALANATEPKLRIYCTGDGPDVYEDDFMKIAKSGGETFHPTVILVGTRLGIDKITPVYWEALIASLQMPQSIGIAGGRPSSSYYFIGVQGQYFFYLDPHYTRPALPYHDNPQDYSQDEVDTCHTRKLRRLHIREIDPSMLIGFLIRNEDDWKDWRRGVKHVQGKTIIHVSDHNPLAQCEEQASRVEAMSDDEDDEDETILG